MHGMQRWWESVRCQKACKKVSCSISLKNRDYLGLWNAENVSNSSCPLLDLALLPVGHHKPFKEVMWRFETTLGVQVFQTWPFIALL